MGMGVMGCCTFSSDDIVIKSPNDKRLYRVIKLENGLTALLIHDPQVYPQGPPHHSSNLEQEEEEDCEAVEEEKEEEGDVKRKEEGGASETKKAAAAMCVGIGSFSDPLEAQGLAHFLEHMLFMGSTKFPDENEYASYLSKHGGSSNAYTEAEHTCYYFDVKREFLKGALERFSQFFVSPLMKSEAMAREVQAIDSEFNTVLQNDFCRLQQLQGHTSSPGHPFNKFSWGNKKSLDDAKKKGINLQEQILKLYRDNYHGGLMKLVVIGGESLDVLEHWVSELFGDVKKDPQVNLEFKAEGPIWKAGKLYRLEAVDDVHILHLAWTLPCLQEHYLKKPEDYLSHLLGHEGRGSLHFYLKARGWVTSLDTCLSGMDCSSVAYIFCMVIYLTDSGLEKMFEIIGFVYQYIKLLSQMSPQEWIFRELQDIGNMDFRFAEEQDQDDYASQLAENLLYYATEHVIYGDYVNESWDKELIEYVLGFFRPENMRIDVISKSLFKSEDFQCEPWFGSHYTEEDISPSLIDLWKNPQEINVSLHLPAKNDFIPRDFSIRSDVLCIDTATTSYPKCILDEPLMKFWYKLDSTFKLPHVNTYFSINLKGAYDDVKSCVLTSLYLDLLTDQLNEILYEACVASLGTSFSLSLDKLQLEVCGFNDKLPALLSKILETIKSFLPTDDRFEVYKEDMERAYMNTNMDPWSYSTYLRDQVLLQKFYTVDEQLHVLKGLSVSDLKSFIPEIFSQAWPFAWQLSEEETINLAKLIQTNFTVPALPTKLVYKDHCICLPPNANLVRDATVKNKSETNSVTELYFQIEQAVKSESVRLKVLIDLFQEIVQEPLFNQLRTKEQLGYVVLCGQNCTCNVFGFYFCVQSSEYNPIHLQGRLDNFIDGLEELLEGLDDDSFENYKGGLMAKVLEKDAYLTCETNRLWTQILDKWYTFDCSKKAAEQLRSIQKEDVINFYKTYLQQSSPKRRRLATRVWGCNQRFKRRLHEARRFARALSLKSLKALLMCKSLKTLQEAEEARPESVQVIEDLAAFKMSSKFYGCKRCQKVTPLKS
ncbi:putative insulysin [Rosa chinensis]|uniref:Putative insulysin n=1 Tax=Rosa chinensis TaxID=74649 RepID=A0A2P6QKU9_ROSCH|nr:putative insulysin [Rosa chinensis]